MSPSPKKSPLFGEDESEECIVDTECLTGITIKKSKIHNGSRDIQNNSSLELAMIDSDFGSCSVEIPKDQFNILLDFELQAKEKSVDDEAFEYVVGYVAKRFIGKYPQLGEIATPLTNNELSCSWTEYKSMGNLVKPTKL
ncbi:uncharacterized protein LOC111027529 [Myzus persicae]|uniref:uncharacterized protein LOC111027529 n=1 Tax=Myzus persicae TaxID=13164 RepID=UPI000B937AA0|nr:uncharacterized protein LOC111027529 [Myzus persicae]